MCVLGHIIGEYLLFMFSHDLGVSWMLQGKMKLKQYPSSELSINVRGNIPIYMPPFRISEGKHLAGI